jgi:hypothetical protein
MPSFIIKKAFKLVAVATAVAVAFFANDTALAAAPAALI